MALNIVYPSPAAFKTIEPDLIIRDRSDRLGLKIFPVVSSETHFVRWQQRDNYYGLMQMRGIDGQPPRVNRLGVNTFVYEPGVFGEHIVITERELLTRSVPNNPTVPIDVADLVLDADTQLINRLDTRMEACVWTLLTTGTLSIPLPGPTPGSVVVYNDTYTIQTYTAPIPWATSATAVPILNLQTIQQLSLGHGVSFGVGAVAYMNQATANLLLNNANAADFGGRRSQYGQTFNNIDMFNNYFAAQGLPTVVVYDQGYQRAPLSGPITSASLQFVKFIPDHIVVVVGKRPGNSPVGEFQQTVQAMNPMGAPSGGEYRFVKNYANGTNAPVEVPPKLEVHRGFNGGPTIFYPSAIVVATV